jgi:hypothetical protein
VSLKVERTIRLRSEANHAPASQTFNEVPDEVFELTALLWWNANFVSNSAGGHRPATLQAL